MIIDFEQEIRGLEFIKYDYDLLVALFKYRNSSMVELNRNRAVVSIDSIITEMEELKNTLTQ